MVGAGQLHRVLEHVEKAGAKAVLVGDCQQLQSIEAGKIHIEQPVAVDIANGNARSLHKVSILLHL